MRFSSWIILAGWLLAAPLAWSSVVRYSSFDTTTEGWTITSIQIPGGGGTGPVHFASGGVGGGGFILTEDTANGRLWFVAPPSWTGDYFGGGLSFYFKNPNPNVIPAPLEPLARISDGVLDLYFFGGSAPGEDWVFNSVSLGAAAGWFLNSESWLPVAPASLSQLESVASGLTSLWINADWVSRFAGHPLGDFGADITSLDEVRLVPIPEPATCATLGAGIALLAFFKARPRRKAGD